MKVHSFSPHEGDFTPLLREILANVCGPTRLIFEPGRYDFWPQRATERFLFVSNNDAGLKRIAFCMEELSNVEIDGQGAHFRFHGAILPFLVSNCCDVRIANISFDFERPFHSEAQVLEADENGVVLKVASQFPYQIQHEKLTFIGTGGPSTQINNALEFCTTRRETALDVTDNYGIGAKHHASHIAPQTVRMEAKFRQIPTVGNTLAFTMMGSRHFPGIVLTKSRQVELENIHIHHAGGMGVIAQHCHDVFLRNVVVAPRHEEGRMVSTVADATHFVNCRGLVSLENCRFENQLDDSTNVHGTYAKIETIVDSHCVEVALHHHQQWGFELARVGERLEFIRPDVLQPYFEAVLARVEAINQQLFRLEFEEILPLSVRSGDAVLNLDWVADVSIRGCTARGNRARGFLLSTAGRIIVENNHIHTPGAAIQIAGDANFWFESGPVRDVTIRANLFDNCLYGTWSKATIEVNPEIRPEFRSEPHYHRGIVVENNHFRAFDGRLLAARCVDGLIIQNNTLERTTDYPLRHWDGENFSVRDCTAVEIAGNTRAD